MANLTVAIIIKMNHKNYTNWSRLMQLAISGRETHSHLRLLNLLTQIVELYDFAIQIHTNN